MHLLCIRESANAVASDHLSSCSRLYSTAIRAAGMKNRVIIHKSHLSHGLFSVKHKCNSLMVRVERDAEVCAVTLRVKVARLLL